MAARIESIFRDEYSAGLWKPALATDLIWFVKYPRILPRQASTKALHGHGPQSIIRFSSRHQRLNIAQSFLEIREYPTPLQAKGSGADITDTRFNAIEYTALVLKGKLRHAEWIRYVDIADSYDPIKTTSLEGVRLTVFMTE
jgi:hypothetical protein